MFTSLRTVLLALFTTALWRQYLRLGVKKAGVRRQPNLRKPTSLAKETYWYLIQFMIYYNALYIQFCLLCIVNQFCLNICVRCMFCSSKYVYNAELFFLLNMFRVNGSVFQYLRCFEDSNRQIRFSLERYVLSNQCSS